MNTAHCAEVLSRAPTARTRSASGDAPEVGTGGPVPQAKALLIHERVEGFFLERLTDRGESVGTTQHDTMDEAMSPYLDTSPINAVTSAEVTAIKSLTQAQYDALAVKDPRTLYLVT